MNCKPYSWQSEIWGKICDQWDRRHHAMLLVGPKGTGKLDFALSLIAKSFCEKSDNSSIATSCGNCSQCHLFLAGTHPDFVFLGDDFDHMNAETKKFLESYSDIFANNSKTSSVTQKKNSTVITVDQIRTLSENISYHAHSSNKKIVLLSPAEALSSSSGNALLKMLEEPKGDVYFILVGTSFDYILSTILSRCCHFYFPVVSQKIVEQYLAEQQISLNDDLIITSMSEGAPLLQASLFKKPIYYMIQDWKKSLDGFVSGDNDIVTIAKFFSEKEIGLALLFLYHEVRLEIKNTIIKTDQIIIGDFFAREEYLFSLQKQIGYYLDRFCDISNHQVMFESIFASWYKHLNKQLV